jgi:Zn-dependent protease
MPVAGGESSIRAERPFTCQGAIMSIDRIVLAFAGTMIIVSLLLGYYVSPYWLALAAFVGVNLFQSAFTGFCPLALILKKAGVRSGAAFN